MFRNKLLWFTALLLSGGLACWGAYALIGSEVDAQGILHEPFFLIPIGWLFVFASLTIAVLSLIRYLVQALRKLLLQEKNEPFSFVNESLPLNGNTPLFPTGILSLIDMFFLPARV